MATPAPRIDGTAFSRGNTPTDASSIANLSSAEKYERLAFTFCKMGTTGLLAWLLTPPIFVLLVAAIAVGLYGRALTLGLTRSKCFLRKPALIIAFWGLVGIADAAWLLWPHLG